MMQIINSTNKVLVVASILLLIHGTIGFSMFVFEESMQTMMFAAFAYKEAKDWHGLEMHVERMQVVHNASVRWVYTFGWFAPVMMPAYVRYLQANQAYIDSQRSLVASVLEWS